MNDTQFSVKIPIISRGLMTFHMGGWQLYPKTPSFPASGKMYHTGKPVSGTLPRIKLVLTEKEPEHRCRLHARALHR